MNVLLCGLPGVGKTFFGQKIAQHFSKAFIDTDLKLEASYTKIHHERLSCREIFLKHGEEAFREYEMQILQNLSSAQDTIIALGGGTLMKKTSRDLLRDLGFKVFLHQDPLTLFSKMRQPLPVFLDPLNPLESFLKLAEIRIPLYSEFADLKIDCEETNSLKYILKSIKAHLHGK
ncbi:MAG: shikimate kinase [Chlamydiales bacterium]